MTIHLTALADLEERASSHRLAWLASDDDGTPLGSAFLRLFTNDGQRHLAEVDVRVHPAERRRGVGKALLDAALEAATVDGRRAVMAETEPGTDGARFLSERDFRKVLTLIFTRLSLADAHPESKPCAGYRLVSWDGEVPSELAETFAESRRAMDDMPMGEVDYGRVDWDVEQVKAIAKAVEKRGELLHTVAAVHEETGAIAGFTELTVPGTRTGDGQNYGTGVLPGHRGHGLGHWMKAEAIRLVRERHPEVTGLLTDTAEDNTPMRRVNEALGYVTVRTTARYQRKLGEIG
ncbi:GNAT family N-acetyltransferase [Amycolatopsis sp. CA-230715]|uniref:GNAT family N-acetyltransferase n=1 Tax=Amycolatopsis sp. CA-230715 TaxID=2745196 RepID=UPI001C016D20|nr:GNAT family N-acetyltransferase [Amycolatopsis sp. CA-230715]